MWPALCVGGRWSLELVGVCVKRPAPGTSLGWE